MKFSRIHPARFQAIRAGLAFVRQRRAILLTTTLLIVFLTLCFLIRTPALQEYDAGVTLRWQVYRNLWLDSAALMFTFLGNGKTLVVLGIAVSLFFFVTRRHRTAMLCLLSLLGHPLTLGIKESIGRKRPGADVVQILLPGIGLSFPSGHALASVLFYGFIALLCFTLIHELAWRVAATLLFVGLIVGIGFSRIYLGAHWLSDVVGGWTAGLFFLLLLAQLHQSFGKSELTPPKPPTSS